MSVERHFRYNLKCAIRDIGNYGTCGIFSINLKTTNREIQKSGNLEITCGDKESFSGVNVTSRAYILSDANDPLSPKRTPDYIGGSPYGRIFVIAEKRDTRNIGKFRLIWIYAINLKTAAPGNHAVRNSGNLDSHRRLGGARVGSPIENLIAPEILEIRRRH